MQNKILFAFGFLLLIGGGAVLGVGLNSSYLGASIIGDEEEAFESVSEELVEPNLLDLMSMLEVHLQQGIEIAHPEIVSLVIGRRADGEGLENETNKEKYTIDETTCRNGVMIQAWEAPEDFTKDVFATLNIKGVVREARRLVFSRELTFSPEHPSATLHLPSQILLDNDTVFPYYTISAGSNPDKVRYDVSCY